MLGGVQNGQASRQVWKVRKSGARYGWERYGDLPEPRLFASAVAAGKRLYLLGGTSKFEPYDAKGTCCTSATATRTLWVLDTSDPAKRWKDLTPYPGEARWAQQAETDGVSIYMFGGRYQRWDAVMEIGGRTQETTGWLGYDRNAQEYQLCMITSFSSGMGIYRGQGDLGKEGLVFVLEQVDTKTGAHVRRRNRLKLITNDHFVSEDVDEDGIAHARSHYRRVKK